MEKIVGCPYHSKLQAEFKPFDLTNPFPFYQKARTEEPVFYNEELGYWVVTRYADIKEVFGNWQVFLLDLRMASSQNIPLQALQPLAKTG